MGSNEEVKLIFSTGTDEHGQKVQQAAALCGLTPQAHCDKVAAEFQRLCRVFHVEPTRFIRTTDKDHHAAVEALWERLCDAGHVYKGHHEGWYSVSDEVFYPETQVTETVDDEGRPIKVSTESGSKVEWIREENYMFRLSAFRPALRQWYASCPEFISPPSRLHQIMSWLDDEHRGLQDLSLSRPHHRQSWGIPVPGDASQTVYVWLDALANYLTVTGFPYQWNFDRMDNMIPQGFPMQAHILGKDILRFHALYWPAFLMAAGLPLPHKLVVHGHWTVGRVKMSKSLGNVVDPFALAERYPVDAIRYFLLRDGGLSHDGDFSEDFLRMRYQLELVNQWGNLLARCLNPIFHPAQQNLDPQNEQDISSNDKTEMMKGPWEGQQENLIRQVDAWYLQGDISKSLNAIQEWIQQANQWITQEAPWKAIKEPQQELKARTVVASCLEVLRVTGILLQPIMPNVTKHLLDRLNVPITERGMLHALNTVSLEERRQPHAGKFILLPRLK